MKKFLSLLIFTILLTGGNAIMAENLLQPFEQGEVNPYGKFFTGTTYLNMLVTKDNVWNSSIGNVTFEPNARTNWHTHSGGQILLVTAGKGLYKEENKPIRILTKGDVIQIPPDIKHWHGSYPNEWFAHISVESNIPNNTTTWLKPVSDEQYTCEVK